MTEPEKTYFVFVLIAAIGVIQITAAVNGLRGLRLTRSRFLSSLIGIGLVAGAILWFLLTSDGYVLPGVEGQQQGILFLLASVAAVLVTLVLASLLQWERATSHFEAVEGLDALKEMTYWQAIQVRLKGMAKDKVLRH